MKTYQNPQLEILEFESDVVVTSRVTLEEPDNQTGGGAGSKYEDIWSY